MQNPDSASLGPALLMYASDVSVDCEDHAEASSCLLTLHRFLGCLGFESVPGCENLRSDMFWYKREGGVLKITRRSVPCIRHPYSDYCCPHVHKAHRSALIIIRKEISQSDKAI